MKHRSAKKRRVLKKEVSHPKKQPLSIELQKHVFE